MTDQPGDHPLPHPELVSQTPLIFTVKAGDVFYRHHRAEKDPDVLWNQRSKPFRRSRLSSSHAFGVLYAGEDAQCCFIESCGPTTGVPAVSGAYLDDRAIATLELTEDLGFIDLYSTGGLTRIGADGRLFTGSYKIAQQWSAVLQSASLETRGIRYPPVTIIPAWRMRSFPAPPIQGRLSRLFDVAREQNPPK